MLYTSYNQPIDDSSKIQLNMFSPKNKSLMMITNQIPANKPATMGDYVKTTKTLDASTTAAAPKTGKKPMIWGEPTWFLFHTISHKVKDESFPIIRKELLQICYNICANLPCPECASHATSHLNNVNFDAIQTKPQLKEFFYQFHNYVNKRKHFDLFPREELDAKYARANTNNIILNFMHYFQDKASSNKMIANELYRARIILRIKEWFSANIHHFEG